MNYPALSPELEPSSIFPFELDQFQKDAIASLNAGRSVVVCAPTGSGKTLVGEYAIYRALSRGKRVFYTTPLKALSNQKLRDFREKFGFDHVGLLTGDASINRDASILVMTTEIFRNMLYGTPIGQIGISLVDVEAMVLDECHYMNDRQRGTVWEESIIYCPREIQLVALSATVANSDELTDWLNQVHGPTDLIYSDHRPVPLEFHFGNIKGLFPLLNDDKTQINQRLLRKKKKGEKNKSKANVRAEAPSMIQVLGELHERDMLPAIYFIFSRRGCDKAVAEVGSDMWLVDQEEAQQLRWQIDEFLSRNPEAGRSGHVGPLYRGIAAHHAGILPAWKVLVEELFQQGLIKVVFATETLAAGINMPARTTVISTLSKRTDSGHRLLNASEFLQMAGRAGRRGMDERGHVVTLQTPFEGAKEAAYLATSQSDPLVSQFTPSYGMVLNLLQTHTLEEAKELVERSFGQYSANLHLRPQHEYITHLQTELAQLQAQIAAIDEAELAVYEKLRQRLRVERLNLKMLQEQAQEARQQELGMMLDFAVSGTLLSLKSKNFTMPAPITAVLVGKTLGSSQTCYLVCLGRDNRWYVATASDVIDLFAELPRIDIPAELLPPPEMPLKRGQSLVGDEQTAIITQQIPEPSEAVFMPPEVLEQLRRVTAVQEQLEAHPLHQSGDAVSVFKRRTQVVELEAEIELMQGQIQQQSQRHWEEFLNLIEILQQFQCLENLVPTRLGQMAAAIRGENELWLGLALEGGELDNLDPHHLAAAIAALVTETPRPDSMVRFDLSEAVAEALSKLRGIRRKIFQLQRRYNVALPIWLEFELIALVEQWALGMEWIELCENTSLDEGDVVRILRRTLDLLSQIPHVPYLSQSLQRNAHRAMQLIDRFPVNEVGG
ncbi:MAG: DEAD/DEAH box helicase [Brasilonema octagenarum HA4186-MV1]|uniref:RNA helicase n=2 Tax=Brasilonema TaxID=383614 RepID=A0A856MD05_9CYAN|nr:RNA helicase [Brasilonema sennae]MBW4626458.1 DEAD/DEAH box helicase [Brasilonema octagenarum HA4186-MV1]NMF62850.1 RNA helicase [Brasilonema octagenarum UFV-OR1]QDL07581.1 RNA helicase [Brasilonema sennae CENA114]QDL13943.1 RNA helicase [Brasilonema octagenarum UFV-E1]